ncbi:hypothetical protein ACJX0J_042567, partial [Zea mays]
VVNDILNPSCQNLHNKKDLQGTRVDGIKEVVLSHAHALSLIAAGEARKSRLRAAIKGISYQQRTPAPHPPPHAVDGRWPWIRPIASPRYVPVRRGQAIDSHSLTERRFAAFLSPLTLGRVNIAVNSVYISKSIIRGNLQYASLSALRRLSLDPGNQTFLHRDVQGLRNLRYSAWLLEIVVFLCFYDLDKYSYFFLEIFSAMICPVCRGIYNCSICRTKKGWFPTGSACRKLIYVRKKLGLIGFNVAILAIVNFDLCTHSVSID